MRQPDSASPGARRARMFRGVAAVLAFLRAQDPQSTVEVLPKNSHDTERNVRTFSIRNGGAHILVRVTDEVLDLDAGGVTRLLRQLPVARAVRMAPTDAVVAVTTHEVTVEPT